jgi:hypothetical protein
LRKGEVCRIIETACVSEKYTAFHPLNREKARETHCESV